LALERAVIKTGNKWILQSLSKRVQATREMWLLRSLGGFQDGDSLFSHIYRYLCLRPGLGDQDIEIKNGSGLEQPEPETNVII